MLDCGIQVRGPRSDLKVSACVEARPAVTESAHLPAAFWLQAVAPFDCLPTRRCSDWLSAAALGPQCLAAARAAVAIGGGLPVLRRLLPRGLDLLLQPAQCDEEWLQLWCSNQRDAGLSGSRQLWCPESGVVMRASNESSPGLLCNAAHADKTSTHVAQDGMHFAESAVLQGNSKEFNIKHSRVVTAMLGNARRTCG